MNDFEATNFDVFGKVMVIDPKILKLRIQISFDPYFKDFETDVPISSYCGFSCFLKKYYVRNAKRMIHGAFRFSLESLDFKIMIVFSSNSFFFLLFLF